MGVYTFCARPPQLSVLPIRAMRRPLTVERATVWLSRFFVLLSMMRAMDTIEDNCMWIIVLIIGIIVVIAYNSKAHQKDLDKIQGKKGTPELTPEAKNLMSDFHKDLTKGQRYAYYNLLSTLEECHEHSSSVTKNKVAFTLRQTAQFLNISADHADAYLRQNGVDELCAQLGSIPKGAQLDSIISTAFGIAICAEGRINGMMAKEMALTILQKVFEEAGISEQELTHSLEKTALLTSKFI